MKIIFMGTPDFAVPSLRELIKHHEVVCVYCQPPKEAGRGHKVTKTPVHIFAEENNIEVRTPKSLRNAEEQEKFKALGADISIVAAYGLILPNEIINACPMGCVNVHGSLLPRWRGAAPIHRAIEAGDDKTGITIMKVVLALDAGDMLKKAELAITDTTTVGQLHDDMSELGARLMTEVLNDWDSIVPEVQDESLVTYAKKIEKSESKLDFSLSCEELERKVRAFNPYPATFFEYEGERFKVLEAEALDADSGMLEGTIVPNDAGLIIACGQGMLLVTQIQRQGKKAMSVAELLKGFSFENGYLIK